MAIGVTFIVIMALIVSIWVLVEIQRLKHKLFAVFLIGLILFSYISAALVFKEQDIDFKTIPGLTKATKVYFSWLGSIFINMKSITINAIKMDWVDGENRTSER